MMLDYIFSGLCGGAVKDACLLQEGKMGIKQDLPIVKPRVMKRSSYPSWMKAST
jgi:hypothetical protein